MHILKNTRIYKVLLAILYVFVFLINDPQITAPHNLEMNCRETIQRDLAGGLDCLWEKIHPFIIWSTN